MITITSVFVVTRLASEISNPFQRSFIKLVSKSTELSILYYFSMYLFNIYGCIIYTIEENNFKVIILGNILTDIIAAEMLSSINKHCTILHT